MDNSTGNAAISSEIACQWLQALASPIEDLKKKINETRDNASEEKRKSLSLRKKNSNRQPSPLPNKDRIEVMEALLKVYKEELEAIEQFVKVLATFLAAHSEENLESLFKPYQKLLQKSIPKSTLSAKGTPTPIRRNSSRRNSKRRRKNQSANSPTPPPQSKLAEIIEALKELKDGNTEPIHQGKEKLLSLKYYGGHFQEMLQLEDVPTDESEGEKQEIASQSEEGKEKTEIGETNVEKDVQVSLNSEPEIIESSITKFESVQVMKVQESVNETTEIEEPIKESEAGTLVEMPKFTDQVEPLVNAIITTTKTECPEPEVSNIPERAKIESTLESVVNFSSETQEMAEIEQTNDQFSKFTEQLELTDVPVISTFEVTNLEPELPKVLETYSETADNLNILETTTEAPPCETQATGPIETIKLDTTSESLKDLIVQENPSLALPVIDSLKLSSFKSEEKLDKFTPELSVQPLEIKMQPIETLPINVEHLVTESVKTSVEITDNLKNFVPKKEKASLVSDEKKTTEKPRYGTFSSPPVIETEELPKPENGQATAAIAQIESLENINRPLPPGNDMSFLEKKAPERNGEQKNGKGDIPEPSSVKNGSKSTKKNSKGAPKSKKNKTGKNRPDSNGAKPKCCSIM